MDNALPDKRNFMERFACIRQKDTPSSGFRRPWQLSMAGQVGAASDDPPAPGTYGEARTRTRRRSALWRGTRERGRGELKWKT